MELSGADFNPSKRRTCASPCQRILWIQKFIRIQKEMAEVLNGQIHSRLFNRKGTQENP